MREIVVEQGDVIVKVTVDGTAQAQTTKVRSTVGGTVAQVLVSTGDFVEAGEPLLQLNDEDYRLKLASARLSLDEALLRRDKAHTARTTQIETEKRRIETLELQLAGQERQYQFMLAVKEAYSRHELELMADTVASAMRNLQTSKDAYAELLSNTAYARAEELAVEQAQAALRAAQTNLDKTTVRAPSAGKLARLDLAPGDPVGANQELAVLVSPRVDKVIARVSEQVLPKLTTGQTVSVCFDALGDEPLSGIISAIDALPATASTAPTYGLTVTLIEPTQDVQSGMTCTVDFVQAEARNVVIIPTAAILDLDDKKYVQMKAADGSVGVREITTGLNDGRYVEVTTRLIPGERILVKLPTK